MKNILIIFYLLSCSVFSQTIDSLQQQPVYLHDYTGTFSSSEVSDAEQYLDAFKKNTEVTFQIVVIDSIEVYGIKTFGKPYSRARHENLKELFNEFIIQGGVLDNSGDQIFFLLSKSDQVFELRARTDLINDGQLKSIKTQYRQLFENYSYKDFITSVSSDIVNNIEGTLYVLREKQRLHELHVEEERIKEEKRIEELRIQKEKTEKAEQESIDRFLGILKYVGISFTALLILIYLIRYLRKIFRNFNQRNILRKKKDYYNSQISILEDKLNSLQELNFEPQWAKNIFLKTIEKLQEKYHKFEKTIVELRDYSDIYYSDSEITDIIHLFKQKQNYLEHVLPNEIVNYNSVFEKRDFFVQKMEEYSLQYDDIVNNFQFSSSTFVKRFKEIGAEFSSLVLVEEGSDSHLRIVNQISEWDREISISLDTLTKNSLVYIKNRDLFLETKKKYDYLPGGDESEDRIKIEEIIAKIEKHREKILDSQLETFIKNVDQLNQLMEKF